MIKNGLIQRGGLHSLPEAFHSVNLPKGGGWLRRFLAFAGPGYLVSVGYMDPGNWGTDLLGGSKFGYTLLWVILVSNLMAQFLQVMCARLGLVTGKDLAMACRDYYPKPVAFVLWILCEIAIIACDLAEVVGSAVGLQLLFGIPLVWGVLITGADVLLLLALMKYGFRKLEAIVITLVFTIGLCFAFQMFLARPDVGSVFKGLFIPSMPNTEALLISVGILGATVMPHNLYLHSSIVQTRKTGETPEDLKQAIRFNTADTIIALSLAFFVNAAILILAASIFHARGIEVSELQQGHELLSGVLGGAAATAFAVALLSSGQSSTITGTLAGQIVMEGFLKIRVSPWLRRMITRGLAIIPALIIVSASGGKGTINLLVWSQVVLSMQLSFAIFPLMAFTSNRKFMGRFANPLWVQVLGYIICTLIASLNIYLLWDTLHTWIFLPAGIGLAFSAWVKFWYLPRQPEKVPEPSADPA